MTTGTAQFALLGILAMLLITAMATDWRAREIPNWLTIAVALLAPLWWWASGYALWPQIGMQLIFCGIVFLAGLGLFAINAMGGGDVKLLAALALWLPGLELLRMLIVMSLIGGALTIAMLVFTAGKSARAIRKYPMASPFPQRRYGLSPNEILTNLLDDVIDTGLPVIQGV